MSTHIFLPPEACSGVVASVTVCRVTEQGSQSMEFADAVAGLTGHWTLVIPVEVVTACAVNLPTRKARWLKQALPYAVEDWLAEDVDLMHLALGEQMADGRHRVFAVRRSWLVDCLALCPQPPQVIAVDADLLPAGGSSLLDQGGRCLLGGDIAARLAFRPEEWPQLQPLCATPVRVWHEQDTILEADEQQHLADAYVWLAQQPVRNNLAQGEFMAQSSSESWQRFKPVVGLLVLWLALQWGFNVAQGWHFQNKADEYAAASAALYRELFPEDSKLINIRAQFDQHLQGATGASQARLLGLLSQVSVAQEQAGRKVDITQVDFSESRGDLAMQVVAGGFADLEQLREQLQSAGLSVQLGSATREGPSVTARVVVGG